MQQDPNVNPMQSPTPSLLAFYTHQQKYSTKQQFFTKLSEQENDELLLLVRKIFDVDLIQNITDNFEAILANGTKIPLLPDLNDPHERTEDYALNNPSLIEQFISIYVSGPDWQFNPKHDGHAGRVRDLNFFKAIYGTSEAAVKEKLVSINWLENTFGVTTKKILVTNVMQINKKFEAIIKELGELIEASTESERNNYLKFLVKISGTFCWRVIANTSRLSAHSFGMTLDLNAGCCEYWLWDYNASQTPSANSSKVCKESDIPLDEIPEWHNSVPWKIIEIFEKHSFIWGGKWNKYDTMHFEYRPEAYKDNEDKERIRELLEKAGYKLLKPQNIHIMRQQHKEKRLTLNL